jgi:hypothetical protein
MAGGFDKLNVNTLGPAVSQDAIRSGRQVGLPALDNPGDSEEAADAARAIRSLVQPGADGKLVFDFTAGGLASFANSSAEQFAELDGYQITNNLGSIGESVTPEKREELRRLSETFQQRQATLNDADRQDAFGKMAANMGAAMDERFSANNLQVSASGMERFFKFDPNVPNDENFLAKLGGYISLVRGEAPDGAFAPRAAMTMEKNFQMLGSVSANQTVSTSQAFGKTQQLITGAKTNTPGNGGVPPAGGSLF